MNNNGISQLTGQPGPRVGEKKLTVSRNGRGKITSVYLDGSKLRLKDGVVILKDRPSTYDIQLGQELAGLMIACPIPSDAQVLHDSRIEYRINIEVEDAGVIIWVGYIVHAGMLMCPNCYALRYQKYRILVELAEHLKTQGVLRSCEMTSENICIGVSISMEQKSRSILDVLRQADELVKQIDDAVSGISDQCDAFVDRQIKGMTGLAIMQP